MKQKIRNYFIIISNASAELHQSLYTLIRIDTRDGCNIFHQVEICSITIQM